mmetsp:Transcript_50679/g.135048  ORF Transcript_50679/g.135048 Transcript_50679/m.135048 type:complete len:206 (+) Transcript_50679:324-941(+)
MAARCSMRCSSAARKHQKIRGMQHHPKSAHVRLDLTSRSHPETPVRRGTGSTRRNQENTSGMARSIVTKATACRRPEVRSTSFCVLSRSSCSAGSSLRARSPRPGTSMSSSTSLAEEHRQSGHLRNWRGRPTHACDKHDLQNTCLRALDSVLGQGTATGSRNGRKQMGHSRSSLSDRSSRAACTTDMSSSSSCKLCERSKKCPWI